jgi:hypothetical protein
MRPRERGKGSINESEIESITKTEEGERIRKNERGRCSRQQERNIKEKEGTAR